MGTIVELVPRIASHLAGLPRRLDSFRELEYQSEGWFKTELLLVLLDLKRDGVVDGFDREVSFGTRQKVDVAVTTQDVTNWIELKHWLIGTQRGSRYAARFYFTDSRDSTLMADVRKLAKIEGKSRRWVLALLTTNPGSEDWEAALAAYRARTDAIPLMPRTDPSDFPEAFFLALLEVV